MPQDPRVAQLLSDFEQGLTRLYDTDAWRRHLEFQARFHRYSSFNVFVIQLQAPRATQVASYKTWQALGRQVRRGERAIQVLAPRTSRKIKQVGEDGEETLVKVEGRFFGLAYVFDISQTDGPPLPISALLQRLDGEGGEALVEALVHFAQAQGHTIEWGPIPGGTQGTYQPATGVIQVRDDLPALQRAKVLAHELAHAILHPTFDMARPDCELEAESVAYVVLRHFGLDAGAYSFGYVANWQHQAGQDATKALRASAGRIQRAARAIIEGAERATAVVD